MYQAIFLSILVIISKSVDAQDTSVTDSLIYEMCQTLSDTVEHDMETKLNSLFSKHLGSFFELHDISNEDSLINAIDVRLQVLCPLYATYLHNTVESKGDWEISQTSTPTEISIAEEQVFYNQKHYYYLEASGDTTTVTIDNGLWIDKFTNGTYSKLNLKKDTHSKFTIEFIESNNEIRQSMSIPGDKYRYTIIRKEAKSYFMTVEIPGNENIYSFKLYYE